MATVYRCRRVWDVLVFVSFLSIVWPTHAATSRPELEPSLAPPHEDSSAALLYAPPLFLPENQGEMRIEIFRAGSLVIRQTIELPPVLPAGAVVEVLVDHPRERERLAALAAVRPESVRLSVWYGDQMLEELALDDLDQTRRVRLSAAPVVVGTPKQIEFLSERVPRRVTAMSYEAGRDPECVQQCQDQLDYCYWEICDPRGSCDFCDDYYDDCVLSCPRCPTTRDYSTVTVTSQSYYSSLACFYGFGTFPEGRVHQFSFRTLRIRSWRETTSCDGTRTTVLLGTTDTSEYCWQQFNEFCSPAGHNNTQYPTCFPH